MSSFQGFLFFIVLGTLLVIVSIHHFVPRSRGLVDVLIFYGDLFLLDINFLQFTIAVVSVQAKSLSLVV